MVLDATIKTKDKEIVHIILYSRNIKFCSLFN